MTVADDQVEETPAIPCSVCRRPLREDDPPKTCHRCVGRARADLHGIVNAYAMLPDILANPLGSNAPRPQEGGRATERPMPGGNALTMLAGGSSARAALRRWLEAESRASIRRTGPLAGEMDKEPPWGADDAQGDPVSIAYELGRHEDEWRRVRGEPASLSNYYVASAVAYLLEHLSWAARAYPEFAEFVEDLRGLRAVLERVTELDDRPVRADAPCFDCGGTLERHYRDRTGLDDDYVCRGCRREYTPAAYYLAVRARLETLANKDQEETG